MNRFHRISIALATLAASAHAQYFKNVEDAHNPGEEHRSFELVMKPYPIPAETTTYVDFVFNLPEDLPEVFHITYGEVINSQPEHLHHFGLFGCPNRVDPELENLPVNRTEMRQQCTDILGFWAPGTDLFGNTDLDTGILMGRGMGIESFSLNVHYTDGIYVDEESKQLKMATDGIRIHYTPVFRPYSSVFKGVMNVITAPRLLQIPPGEPRFFLSKQCQVETGCQDADAETLGFIAGFLGFEGEMEAGLTCESVALFCGLGGVEGSYIKRLCPKTCGLCEAPGDDGTVNPFDPGSYRVTAVWYHAHLLGREMYTTLIRDGDGNGDGDGEEDQVVVTPRQASPVVKDLQSRDFWMFDNQETIPLEFDGIVENDTTMRGTEVRPGDKIQATCVFDATHRDEATSFYLSTYDEMCANIFHVTFPTPARLLEGGEDDSALDLATELQLMTFSCGTGPESDVYAGTLAPDEDGRNIWRDHPVGDADGCTFVASDFMFGGLTDEVHNCKSDEESLLYANHNRICDDGVEFLPDANAGAECSGGTRDGEYTTTGLTEADCITGGGTWVPYTCKNADDWLVFEATMEPAALASMLVEDHWKPLCCAGGDIDGVVADDKTEGEADVDEDSEDVGDEPSPSTTEVSSACGRLRRGAFLASASVVLAGLLWG